MVSCLCSVLISPTHKQGHTAHTGANRLTHPYKYILTPPVMCSQQLSVLHWMNNLPTSTFTLQVSTISLTCRSHIKFNKTKFFPWNTKNIDRYSVNRQNTHMQIFDFFKILMFYQIFFSPQVKRCTIITKLHKMIA